MASDHNVVSWWNRTSFRLKHLGASEATHHLPHRLINVFFPYNSFVCVSVVFEHWHPHNFDPPYEIRPLREDEIGSLVRMNDAEITSEFARRATTRGDECYGIVAGEAVESYLWVAHHATPLTDDLTVHFNAKLAYVYKAFTMPRLRGNGLMPALLRVVLNECANRKYCAAVACIETTNQPSLRAFKTAGFTPFGTVHIARPIHGCWITASPKANDFGFRIVHNPQ